MKYTTTVFEFRFLVELSFETKSLQERITSALVPIYQKLQIPLHLVLPEGHSGVLCLSYPVVTESGKYVTLHLVSMIALSRFLFLQMLSQSPISYFQTRQNTFFNGKVSSFNSKWEQASLIRSSKKFHNQVTLHCVITSPS